MLSGVLPRLGTLLMWKLTPESRLQSIGLEGRRRCTPGKRFFLDQKHAVKCSLDFDGFEYVIHLRFGD